MTISDIMELLDGDKPARLAVKLGGPLGNYEMDGRMMILVVFEAVTGMNRTAYNKEML